MEAVCLQLFLFLTGVCLNLADPSLGRICPLPSGIEQARITFFSESLLRNRLETALLRKDQVLGMGPRLNAIL